MPVRGIDHVAVRRADPERTAAWYIAVFGLQRRLEGAFGPGSPVTIGAGECSLSIFPGARPSFEHLAFEVDATTMAVAADILDARGIAYRRADHGIARSLFLSDPDGIAVEITAYINEEHRHVR